MKNPAPSAGFFYLTASNYHPMKFPLNPPHPDIRQAYTLEAEFYRSPIIFEQLKHAFIARGWHFIGVDRAVPDPKTAYPFTLLPDLLDEPLVLTRAETGTIHCLSNVCTHRGNLLVKQNGKCEKLRCRYHGRRFGLDGKFEYMPGFEQAIDFPGPEDDLKSLPVGKIGRFLFTSLNPLMDFVAWAGPLNDYIGFLPLSSFQLDTGRSKTYEVEAHWALYVENYLEGFHIPFVHKSLAAALQVGDYAQELWPWGSLQKGVVGEGHPAFDFPEGHPDFGKRIGAYYFWLAPNLMLNFYPWGLSMNIVEPMGLKKTRVRFLTYVWQLNLLDKGAGAGLDRVEMEDEEVVEDVQLGLQSRLYHRGRFSPAHEQGVHHFQRMMAQILNDHEATENPQWNLD